MTFLQKYSTQTLEDVRRDINAKYSEVNSWRTIGDKYGITPNMARLIAKGYKPGPKVRSILGLPPISSVTVMGDEPIPDGTQVKRAGYCKCGAPYSPDHPRRNRCYICNPGKNANATR